MTITTQAFRAALSRAGASLGRLCLFLIAGILLLPVMGSATVTLAGKTSVHDHASCWIDAIDAFGQNDVRVVVGEYQADNSRLKRSVVLYSSDEGITWVRQLATDGQPDDREALETVHFVSRNVGWVAGYNGTILKSTDGGGTWQRQNSPIDAILIQMQFVDDKSGWILAEEGGEILHTEDGGENWKARQFSETGRMTSLSFRDRYNGWLVGERGRALQTTDSGKTWVSRGRELALKIGGGPLDDVVFSRVKFVTHEVGFIASGYNYKWPTYSPNSVILETTDGGANWRTIVASKTLGLTYAEFISEKDMWVVLGDYRDERLLHTIDQGKNWTFVPATAKAHIVQFVNVNHGWLIAGLSDYPIIDRLLRTSDGGRNWSEVKFPKWNDSN